MPEERILEHNVYRHFKGGLYKVLFVAQDSETQEPMVVYVALKDGKTWVRKQSNWTEMVVTGKQDGMDVLTKRFTPVPREDPAAVSQS